MSRTRLTLSSEPIQGHNEGCLIKPRRRDPDFARLMRDDYDEVRLNAAGGDPAVENLAGRMGKDSGRCRAAIRWQRTWSTAGSGVCRSGPSQV